MGCEVGEVLGWEERDCEIPGKMCEETGSEYDGMLCFQIERKFRDEIRPRYGMLRGKEFWMKG